MHESSLIAGLVAAAEEAVPTDDNVTVRSVDIEVGMLSAMSPSHLEEHFVEAAAGTRIAGADVVVTRGTELDDHAADVVLRAVHVDEVM